MAHTTRERIDAVVHKTLWPLAVAPSFVVIGAQKAGTTSVYDYLSRLPQVRPARRKEIHYFDAKYHLRPSWYAGQFPLAVPGRRRGWVTGESSPYYLLNPHAPARLAADLPRARLVAIVRNPTERAFSAWAMRRAMGIEPRSFEEALARERAELPAEHTALLADPSRDTTAHRLLSYVSFGRYLEQLRVWESAVGARRIHVMVSERLFSDPATELAALHDFLGLAADPRVTLPASNVGVYGARDEMSPATRTALDGEFHASNAALAEHLGVDLRALGWS